MSTEKRFKGRAIIGLPSNHIGDISNWRHEIPIKLEVIIDVFFDPEFLRQFCRYAKHRRTDWIGLYQIAGFDFLALPDLFILLGQLPFVEKMVENQRAFNMEWCAENENAFCVGILFHTIHTRWFRHVHEIHLTELFLKGSNMFD